jgi:hypothetical protein
MLERVESVLSQNYLVAFAVMWPVGLLSIFVTLALLRSKGPFWHLFLISAVCWTLVCSVDTILFHLFKVLFHARILRALSKAQRELLT